MNERKEEGKRKLKEELREKWRDAVGLLIVASIWYDLSSQFTTLSLPLPPSQKLINSKKIILFILFNLNDLLFILFK